GAPLRLRDRTRELVEVAVDRGVRDRRGSSRLRPARPHALVHAVLSRRAAAARALADPAVSADADLSLAGADSGARRTGIEEPERLAVFPRRARAVVRDGLRTQRSLELPGAEVGARCTFPGTARRRRAVIGARAVGGHRDGHHGDAGWRLRSAAHR